MLPILFKPEQYIMNDGKKKSYMPYVITVTFVIGVWICLELFLRYWFFNREQQQLFLFSGDYCRELLFGSGTVPFRPGGMTVLLSRFIVQFFGLPFVGSAVTLVIILLSSLLFFGVLRRMSAWRPLFPLCFLPSFIASLSLVDSSSFYESNVALLLSMLFLYIYVRFESGNPLFRTVVGIIMTLVLYAVAGAVALLFSVSALAYDVLGGKKKWYLTAASAVVVLITGYIFYYAGMYGEYRQAVLPDMYYDFAVDIPWWHYVSWALLPLVLSAFRYIKGFKSRNLWQYVFMSVLAVAEIGLFVVMAEVLSDKMFTKVAELERYTDNGQWGKVIAACGKDSYSFFESNYLNMALAEEGSLLDRLFDYTQQGPQSLAVDADWSKEAPTLLAHVHYASCNLVQAQNMAFNADCTALSGDNPSMLKLLVKTNLALGAYETAEKYINRLSRSLFYKDWAEAMRRFVRNDKAVMNDPELGRMRRDAPKSDKLMMSNMNVNNLEIVINANPKEKRARDYMIALMLLSKDMKTVKWFVEKYYGTPVMPRLPRVLQQAVVYYATDMDYCAKYNLSSDVTSRFYDFNLAMEKTQQEDADDQTDVFGPFVNTFWYYMLSGQN